MVLMCADAVRDSLRGRAPSRGGQVAYETALNSGGSRASILLAFADKPEHRAHIGGVGQGVVYDIPLG